MQDAGKINCGQAKIINDEFMGWSNYIIIPEWRMAIETSRNINELEAYIEKSLTDAILVDDLYESIEDEEIGDIELNKLNVRNLTILYKCYKILQNLSDIEIDKLFLYWLKSKDISFDIKSEFNVDLDKLENDGYKIIRK